MRLGTAPQGNFIYTEDPDNPGQWIATINPAGYYGSGGSQPNANGGATYTPADNPLLQTDPSATGWDGQQQHFNPNFYSTQQAAQQFAAALGGSVVIDPMSAGFSGAPMYAVRLPDGTTINAGAIGQILGNDAAFPGSTTKSNEIAKLFGAAYDPNIAAALTNGTPIQLHAAAAPAPGYIPTPLQQSYIPPVQQHTQTQTTATDTQPQQQPQVTVIVPVYSPQLSFANLTSGNAPVIVADRDTWRLSISGAAPGVQVEATGTKDGGPASTSGYGYTDSAGNWQLTGTSSTGDVGAWSFVWKAGGTVAGNLNFQVVAAAQPTPTPTTYAPHLSMENLTTANAQVIQAARDTWRIRITGGRPNARVIAVASKDGGAAATADYGATDSAGNFQLTGTSSPGDVGAWVSTWKAGADIAGVLVFRIVAPPTVGDAPTPPQQNATPTDTGSSGTGSSGTDAGSSFISGGSGITRTLTQTAAAARDAVSAAATAAGIPSVWIWTAAAAALLFVSTKKAKR